MVGVLDHMHCQSIIKFNARRCKYRAIFLKSNKCVSMIVGREPAVAAPASPQTHQPNGVSTCPVNNTGTGQTDRLTDTQTDRQTDTQTDRLTDTHTDRQTDTHTYTDRQTQTDWRAVVHKWPSTVWPQKMSI